MSDQKTENLPNPFYISEIVSRIGFFLKDSRQDLKSFRQTSRFIRNALDPTFVAQSKQVHQISIGSNFVMLVMESGNVVIPNTAGIDKLPAYRLGKMYWNLEMTQPESTNEVMSNAAVMEKPSQLCSEPIDWDQGVEEVFYDLTVIRNLTNVRQTAIRTNDLLFLKDNGKVYSLGALHQSESPGKADQLIKIKLPKKIKQFSASESCISFLTEDNLVYISLSKGIPDKFSTAAERLAITNVKQTLTKDNVTFCLTEGGEVIQFEYTKNVAKRNINGDRKSTLKSVKLKELSEVEEIVASHEHIFFRTKHGEVWFSGQSQHVTLGGNARRSKKRPLPDDRPDYITPEKLADLTNITSIVAGTSHVFYTNDKGEVFCSGKNGDGELGMRDFVFHMGIIPRPEFKKSKVERIFSGYGMTIILKNNTLYATGNLKPLGLENACSFKYIPALNSWQKHYESLQGKMLGRKFEARGKSLRCEESEESYNDYIGPSPQPK